MKNLCLAASRSLEDFQADVKTIRERLTAAARREEADRLEPEIEAATAEAGRVDEQINELRREFERARQSLLPLLEAAQARAAGLVIRQTDLRHEGTVALIRTAAPEIKIERKRTAAALQQLAPQAVLSQSRLLATQAAVAGAKAECDAARLASQTSSFDSAKKSAAIDAEQAAHQADALERNLQQAAARHQAIERQKAEIAIEREALDSRELDPIEGAAWR